MKTVIDAHQYGSSTDLSDIGDMIKKYCNEVERLEERNSELEEENRVLKERLREK